MEDLLALFDDHAVAAAELHLNQVTSMDGHLLIVDSDAALLDQTPGLAVGGAQAAGHQQGQMASIFPSVKSVPPASWVQGMLSLLPPPPNRARAASWALSASSSPWTSLVSS